MYLSKCKRFIDFIEDDLCVKYAMIFDFWILGYLIVWGKTVWNYENIELKFKGNIKIIFRVLIWAAAISISVPFEFFFSTLITPFILICFAYHPFFERLLLFFGIGN